MNNFNKLIHYFDKLLRKALKNNANAPIIGMNPIAANKRGPAGKRLPVSLSLGQHLEVLDS